MIHLYLLNDEHVKGGGGEVPVGVGLGVQEVARGGTGDGRAGHWGGEGGGVWGSQSQLIDN